MDPLASLADLQARYAGQIAVADQPRVMTLLADASAVVRAFTRQQFTAASTVERIRPVGYKVRLPQKPVVSVTSVSVVDALLPGGLFRIPLGAWLWDGGQEVWLGQGAAVINLAEDVLDLFATTTPMVEVAYAHGYSTIPDVAVAVTCSMVLRTMDLPGVSGMASQNAGPFGYRLSTAGMDGILALSPSEQLLLKPFRSQSATVEMR